MKKTQDARRKTQDARRKTQDARRKTQSLSIKILAVLTVLLISSITYSQTAPIQNGTSSYNGKLYHTGNIGIGKNNPTANLHVSQSGLLISGSPLEGDLLRLDFEEYIPPISFNTKTRFIVKTNGNVGIGTSNPTSPLHVEGSSLFKGNITLGNNNWTSLTFDGTGNNNWMFNAHNNGSSFHIRANSGSSTGYTNYCMTIDRNTGNVGLNKTAPQAQLHVNGNTIIEGALTIKDTNGANQFQIDEDGNVRSREIKVDLAFIPDIPDYVFSEDYKLMPLAEVKAFIKENKHLPNVKSEAEFAAEGSISLTEMNMKLLEKVEELTLYVLDLQEQIDELKTK